MNLPDEELQNRINGNEEPEGYPESEIKSYQYIFRALRKEPEYRLLENFAEKIVEQVSAKNKTSLWIEHIWLFLSIPGIIIIYITAILITGLKINFKFPESLSGSWGYLLLGVVLLTLVQIIDRKYIRPKYF